MSEGSGVADVLGGPSATPSPIIPEAMAADLVAAWAELGNVHRSKTANAGTYQYSYADLGDLLDVARPILAKHGLALLQPLSRVDGLAITITTMVVHTSGHVLASVFDVHPGQTAQQTGSAITYGRRYAALGALGVAAGGDDDDGKAASAVSQPEAFEDAPLAPTKDQLSTAVRLFEQLEIVSQPDRRTVMAAILDREERTWAQLSRDEARMVIEGLQERVDEALKVSAATVEGLFDE